eukprot:gene20128-biopygen865
MPRGGCSRRNRAGSKATDPALFTPSLHGLRLPRETLQGTNPDKTMRKCP